MSEHVHDVVVRKCAQSLHIIRVLCCRGMNDQALYAVYRSVVIGAKRLNAACAWWGFTTADDCDRIEAVVRRGARAGLYPVDGSAAAQLVEDSDDVLFSRIPNSAHHVLHELFPHPNTHDYKGQGAITCHYNF